MLDQYVIKSDKIKLIQTLNMLPWQWFFCYIAQTFINVNKFFIIDIISSEFEIISCNSNFTRMKKKMYQNKEFISIIKKLFLIKGNKI